MSLSAGSGYTSPPTVGIEPPPRALNLGLRLVPEITVYGPPGTAGQVEWSTTLEPGLKWQVLTNVAVGINGATVVDLAVGSTTRFYRAVTDLSAPDSLALIPAGSFQMGDAFNEGRVDELPVHWVFVSAFYIDKTEVTKALWDEVKGWGSGNGYHFDKPGAGKAADHPVQTVSWVEVLKWCNARSQKDRRVPAYYTDAALTQVYKTGKMYPYVKWDTGYRLPTEAEWEKAARGGSSGHRFPWSFADTITHFRANYNSSSSDAYDRSSTSGYNPLHAVGELPYTSRVGSFAANGYGLFDMAGNVWEWCWDWPRSYSSETQTDPRGHSTGGPGRVLRGGGWDEFARFSRSAFRRHFPPDSTGNFIGFRSVLPPRQP